MSKNQMECRKKTRSIVSSSSKLILASVIAVMFLLALSPLFIQSSSSSAYSNSKIITVVPNGHDDTTDIQSAFNTCVASGQWCTIQLVKGTYHISSQITVYGFQGNFVGKGQGLTTIEALGNMPAPTSTPFWAALPGPSNPWPALFTFEGGSFAISGMTDK